MRRARAAPATLLSLCVALWSVCWVSWSTDAIAGDPDPAELEGLMELLAGAGGVRARFHESRHISILNDPIQSGGVLYFAPPDRLARHTTQPGRASVIVDADRVSIRDETGHRTFDLDASVVVRSLVSNLVVVLRGDLKALNAEYTVEFEAADGSWTLDLEPRSRALRSIVERVRFSGKGRKLGAMETRESNGDRTILTFSEVETGLTWDASALARHFSREGLEPTP